MNKWKIGSKEKFISNNLFYLLVERLETKKISPKFEATNFKFKLTLNSKKETNLYLNDKNVNYLRKGLIILFDKIKKSFKKRDGKFYIQLNLSFEGLKKVFLKSGIIDLFDVHSKNIVYWLINQLDQVEQSSEDLVFNNNFFCDFIVVKTNHPNGKLNFFKSKLYKSNNSKINFYKTSKLKLNLFFNNQIKQGFIDMKLFFNDMFDEVNCIFVSIFFGILLNENNVDLTKTLEFIKDTYKTSIDFENEFIKKYKIFDKEYLKTKTLTFLLNHISNKIKTTILLFSNKNENFVKVIYKTDEYINKLPIKLLFDNNHCIFIIDNNNLEGKRLCFCDFCFKSFSNIKLHKCQRKKCINCHLYFQKINKKSKELTCLSKIVKNTYFQCNYCSKIIENLDCVKRHKELTKTYCSKVLFCKLCNINYSNYNNHECGKKFCKKCFSNHKPELFCSTIYKANKKIKKHCFICDIHYKEENIIYLNICQIENTKYINIYYFNYLDKIYKKLIIDRTNYKTVYENLKTFNFKLSIENVLQEIDVINLKPKVLVDKITFKCIIDQLNLESFKLFSRKNNINKIECKYYSIAEIEDYIDFDSVYLLKKLKFNQCPLYLIKPIKLLNMNFKDVLSFIDIDDFTKEYKNSDLDMFEYIYTYKDSVKIIQNETLESFYLNGSKLKLIILFETFIKMDFFLKSLADKIDINMNKPINKFDTMLNFSSFSSSIFSIFLSTLENQKQPTTSSSIPGTIYNTSKYEICFCIILNKFHKQKYPKHLVKSYINGNGQQFQVGKFSVDWFCKDCKTAIFIEGNFKYICNYHESLIIDTLKKEKRNKLALNGIKKRLQFKKETNNEIDNYFVIGQCCILKNDYKIDFKNSNLYYDSFGKDVLSELKSYVREDYIRMNYQKAIQPAFTCSLENNFISNGISVANKYDINSAYLSVLTHLNFKLPVSNTPKIVLVNDDANIFFQGLNIFDDNFGFVKAFISTNNSYKLPFFPFKNEKNEINYTNCSKCCKNFLIEKCNHNNIERGFYTQGYLNDFLYMKSIGYFIKVYQIIYFESKHNNELDYLARELLNERKNKCDFIKMLSKSAALIGIGRFAFNVDKNVKEKINILNNNQELSLSIETKLIENIELFENYVISFEKTKINNYENAQISTRLNCSSGIFGLVSSFVRKEIYDLYLWIEKYNFNIYKILRIDTDSVIIKCEKEENFEDLEIYLKKSNFQYKKEMSNIKTLFNYGKNRIIILIVRKIFLK